MEFPVFSLMIREFDAEIGSQQTGSSATESLIIVSLLAKSRKRRVHGVICEWSSPEKADSVRSWR